ncbi:PH domain-containing protein [Jejuia pallidilutea]|uniref:PH domain-containing protein n=2 Tax=Jejuia pallidilutea TaxID=504487 RepID=UPI0006934DCF|nr:PH domain-containing protein [Jejuia pallidilutea]
MKDIKVYKSKIEYGFFAVFFLLVIASIFLMILKGESNNSILVCGSILFLILIFLCYGTFSIRYIIEGNTLKIRNGIIYSKDVDIYNIKSIKQSYSIISSPSAAFDRIEVNFNKYDSVLISPNSKQLFINDLLLINPEIKIELKKD